jgi:HEAT repeat protein
LPALLGKTVWDCPAETFAWLRSYIEDDSNVANSITALVALATSFHDDNRTVELLLSRAIDDQVPAMRGAVLTLLGQYFHDNHRSVEMLRLRAVDDPDASARKSALYALARHFRDDTRTVEMLRSRAVDDPDTSARGAALLTLSRTLGVSHSVALCSKDFDGGTGRDPRVPITVKVVAEAAKRLSETEAVIQDLFKQIATHVPLTLAWSDQE